MQLTNNTNHFFQLALVKEDAAGVVSLTSTQLNTMKSRVERKGGARVDLFPQPIELIICTEADKRKKSFSFNPLNDIAIQKYAIM